MRRKVESERWDMKNLELVGGVPWAMNKEKDPEGEEMKHEVVVMDKDYKEIMKEMYQDDEAVPRRAGFSRKDLETHGFTVGCAGCKSVLLGGRRQGHTFTTFDLEHAKTDCADIKQAFSSIPTGSTKACQLS